MKPKSKMILIIASIIMLSISGLLPATGQAGQTDCRILHPINPPDMSLKGQCPNCGMGRPMWARTWFTFDAHEGQTQACSLHCLADLTMKTGSLPHNIKVALYTAPEKSIPVEKAFFVLGSSAKGTMTMQSKPAFASKNDAMSFAESYGGEIAGFSKALETAQLGVPKENGMIAEKRIQMGKIAEPVDNKDQCPVCGMYPARYAKNKCQVSTKNNQKFHFCSTQCLFAYVNDPAGYNPTDDPASMMWVVDYESGRWISAYTAYYVVGSGVQGPMGYEAFPFDTHDAARAFAGKNGGKVLRFSEVTPETIRPKN